MKNLMIMIFLLVGFNSIGQSDNNQQFTSDNIYIDLTKGIHEYLGNACYTNDKLTVNSAEKITYNKDTNEINVYGLSSFSFDGFIHVLNSKEVKSLRYKIGDTVAYIE